MGSEAEGFLDAPPPYSNYHSVWKKHCIDAYFWEQCLAKLGLLWSVNFGLEMCSKENDGISRHFMISEHTTSRYMVLHSNRSHTRRIYRKILNSDEGDFKILVKNGVLEELL